MIKLKINPHTCNVYVDWSSRCFLQAVTSSPPSRYSTWPKSVMQIGLRNMWITLTHTEKLLSAYQDQKPYKLTLSLQTMATCHIKQMIKFYQVNYFPFFLSDIGPSHWSHKRNCVVSIQWYLFTHAFRSSQWHRHRRNQWQWCRGRCYSGVCCCCCCSYSDRCCHPYSCHEVRQLPFGQA